MSDSISLMLEKGLKDAFIVKSLMALDVPLLNYRKQNQEVYFFFDSTKGYPYLKAFLANEPIPLPDIRRYIIAETQFKFILKEAL